MAGATAFTRIDGPSWYASSTVRWISAALLTAYQPIVPVAPSPAIDATLTTAPGRSPAPSPAATAFWTHEKAARTLTSMILRATSSGASRIGP